MDHEEVGLLPGSTFPVSPATPQARAAIDVAASIAWSGLMPAWTASSMP